MRDAVSSPVPQAGKAPEASRVQLRRRLVLAATSLALGALALSAGVLFLRVRVEVAGLSGLILGALLEALGLATAAHAAVGASRAFPLSEAAARARRVLVAAIALVLPSALLGGAGWLVLVALAPPALFPAHPFFWAPVSAGAAIGLVFAARELASERMAVLAGAGAGGILGLALSAGALAAVNPPEILVDPRLPIDLLLVGLAFIGIAAAFERDPWVARTRRLA